MEKVPTENSFLSYISPDPKYPDVGMVRITNSKIKYIAKSEGFYDLEDVNNVGVITDEERLVVKIMLNHNGTVLLKRERENDKQVIAYFHEDGIVSCENESLVLDGNSIKTKNDFFVSIEMALKFPGACEGLFSRFDDWITDLGWINQGTGICIAINSFSEFLADDKETKAMIMEDFEEDILPFWETEVASVVKNGTPRSFIVLTID